MATDHCNAEGGGPPDQHLSLGAEQLCAPLLLCISPFFVTALSTDPTSATRQTAGGTTDQHRFVLWERRLTAGLRSLHSRSREPTRSTPSECCICSASCLAVTAHRPSRSASCPAVLISFYHECSFSMVAELCSVTTTPKESHCVTFLVTATGRELPPGPNPDTKHTIP